MILIISLAGCLGSKRELVKCPGYMENSRVLEVKPLYQAAFECGPASLAMVLNYQGVDVSLERATAELLSKSLQGTLITDMKKFAEKYASNVEVKKSDICEVVDSISRGNPVILFMDLGTSMMISPHYVVAVGYDMGMNELVFHNGYSEFNKAIFEAINENWAKTGFLALYISND